jgi:FADH2 O2-dependent halogenase
VQIDAVFVIDGTGEFGLVPRTLGVGSLTDTLATNSRTIFAHFQSLTPWEEILTDASARIADHPFCCDDAAVHHVIDEGWMYQLRFNNGVTSAGFVLDIDQCPLNPAVSIEDEWNGLLDRYPSLARQFAPTTIVAPPGGLARTGRLQRRKSQMAGGNWALLPHTACFIDPLHSTGIAQTLAGIERLALILREHWRRPTLPAALAGYAATLDREIVHIDKIVSGCFLGRRNFRLFAAFTMFYFAAATVSEHRRASGEHRVGTAFLLADEAPFRDLVSEAWRQIRELFLQPNPSDADIARFEQFVARGIAPYNIAGLCDQAAHNMYRYTAIAKP